MRIGAHHIKFGSILFLFGVVYLSISFLSGETILQMPDNWFSTWMASVFQQMDIAGFFNVWSGQSPGFNYLYFILWKPAQMLAGQNHYFALTFSLIWGLLNIGSLFVGAYFFYKLVAHIWGEEKGTLLGTIYILFFFTMSQWFTVIDPIPIAGLLASIYFSFLGRSKTSGIILGITATLKPMGLLMLPVLLKSEFFTWKSRITMIVASVVAFGGLLLPLALGNFKIFMSSFNWQSGKPPWESVYAFIMAMLNKPYPVDPLFQDASGSALKDWGLTGITPSPAIMTTPVPGYNPWCNAVFVILILIAVLLFVFLKRVRTKQEMLVGILCLLAAYFGFFYGWSPQFVFWIIPFTLVSLPLSLTVALSLLVMLENPFLYAVYLSRIAPDLVTAAPGLTVSMTAVLANAASPLYWSSILVRTALILAIGTMAWIHLPTRLWVPDRYLRLLGIDEIKSSPGEKTI